MTEQTKIINQLIGLLDHKDPEGLWCQGWLRSLLIKNEFWVPNTPVKPKLDSYFPEFIGPVCKGAKVLGSNCGSCAKCKFYGWD